MLDMLRIARIDGINADLKGTFKVATLSVVKVSIYMQHPTPWSQFLTTS